MTHRWKKIISGLILALISTSSFAGSANAVLTCGSTSGRTHFSAVIQDIDVSLESATLEVDGTPLSFDGSDSLHMIYVEKYGLYTIIIESENHQDNGNFKSLQFWALPSTFKKAAALPSGENVWTFEAQLKASEPRTNKSTWTPLIQVSCRLVYGV